MARGSDPNKIKLATSVVSPFLCGVVGSEMLPETLLCLLNVAFVVAQTRQQLSLNVISSFTSSNIPNPPLFTLPQSKNLSITVALCSTATAPRFFVSNSSNTVPGSGSGPQGTEITITDGHGTWTGPISDGGILSVVVAGKPSFELAVSEDGVFLFRCHEHSVSNPHLQ